MNIFDRQAHLVEEWFLVLEDMSETAFFILDKASECFLVNESNMELHHIPIDEMDEVMARWLDQARRNVNWLDLFVLLLL